MMLWNGLRQIGPSPDLARKRLHVRGQTIEIQAIARQRPDQIAAAAFQHRLQRRRVRHVTFLEFAVVVVGGDIEATVRDNAALVERIFVGMAQRHELVVALVDPGNGNCATQRVRSRPPDRAPASAPSASGASSGAAAARGRSRRRGRSPDGSPARPAGASTHCRLSSARARFAPHRHGPSPSGCRPGSPGNPARAASRRAARGSRSIRRNTAAGAARAVARPPEHQAHPPSRAPRSSDTPPGQMPQMRAVMSGASAKPRPRSNASNNRGGSKILSRAEITCPSRMCRSSAPSPSTRAM